jgi:hypothetical protein
VTRGPVELRRGTLKSILVFLVFLIFITIQSTSVFAESALKSNQAMNIENDKMAEEQEQEILRQIAITETLLSVWEEEGLTRGKKLKLDVFFSAPTEEYANNLLKYMAKMTKYNWEAYQSEGEKSYVVQSLANELVVDRDYMLYLAEWMVKAGYENGCSFDGFGALMPEKKAK